MARFNASDIDRYGGQGGAGFFSLKNDGDVARVRFMYNSIDDVEGLSVHQVEIDGKKRYVNCLRAYNESVDKCPFCKAGKPVMAKLFIPLYDEDDDKVKIWERGKKFFGKISGLCARYDKLVEQAFEIERHGKAGSSDTTYELFPVDGEKLSFEDLPEAPEIVGGFVLDKTADDMNYYLDEGEFPPVEEDEEEVPRRRGSRRSESEEDDVPFESEGRQSRRSESRQTSRRTPATSRRRSNEDNF